MEEVRPALCRLCGSYCPILVTVDGGVPTKVTGDRDAPLYEGYTCPKGRALPEQHTGPQRLLRSMRRHDDGTYIPIPSQDAIAQIACKISTIIDRHGPRSVALYWGTGLCTFTPNVAVAVGWMEAIGSPMVFGASAIDKPGAPLAQALHGHWLGGHPPFEAAESWIVVGLNPLISRSGGFPPNNPGRRLKEAVNERGMKLIVIDPRKTETAQRAHLHLMAKPGEDPAILAAMIHVILAENLHDTAFLEENVSGLDALRASVAPYTPEMAASRADIPAEQIVEAARIFARSRYAGVGCGIGPSFSLVGTITEYLASVLMTICGFWSRAGDPVTKPHITLPPFEARAEAMPPFPAWGFGEQLRMRNLGCSVAGMPTGALADEILTEGDGRVRALFCIGSNPMMAWPDQERASRALKKLDLLVTAEIEMSATARMADYVIAPKLSLELPATSSLVEGAKYYGHLRGIEGPYGRYTPAVVAPPEGSDVIADWELYYGLAKKMGLSLNMTTRFGIGQHLEAETQIDPLDMQDKPSDEDLLAMATRSSRIGLETLKRYPHGHMFEEVAPRVLAKRPGATARLDVGNQHMMAELESLSRPPNGAEPKYPFTLLPRRTNRLMNSSGRANRQLGGLEPINPAYMHPDDMHMLKIEVGDEVSIASRFGEVVAIAAADPALRRGCVSITHGFGNNPDEASEPRQDGCNVGLLLSADAEYDPISGIPRMGAVPVDVRALASAV